MSSSTTSARPPTPAAPTARRPALAILCFRHFDDVVRRISMRVPREHVEDQAMTVMLAAIKSAFDGTSIGEFSVWLNRIVARRGIADFHRDREDEPKLGPLPTEHQGEEEIWGEEPSEADETGARGRTVGDRRVPRGAQRSRTAMWSSSTCSRTSTRPRPPSTSTTTHPDLDPPMSEANVHKIVSRFRKCVREKLEDDDQP